MKSPLYSVFIVASLLVAIAHCFPGVPRQSDDSNEDNGNEGADTVLVLPGFGNPFSIPRPLIRVPDLPNLYSGDDDDSREQFNPFRINRFDDFMETLRNSVNKATEMLTSLLSSIPEQGALAPWGKIPEGGNTTSTTKIIAGHIVTTNDTTYQSSDDNGHAVFRVRIVDVKPLNQTLNGGNPSEVDIGGGEEIETVTTEVANTPDIQGEKEETTTQARSVETVEDFTGNEIPKNQVDTLTA